MSICSCVESRWREPIRHHFQFSLDQFSQTRSPSKDPEPVQVFSLDELKASTLGSKSLIKRTDIGDVYHGELSNGPKVAVLELSKEIATKFIKEQVLLRSRFVHTNILHLRGYCEDEDQCMCVYDYMPLGSLKDNLSQEDYHDTSKARILNWKERLQIALDVAAGLSDIHHNPLGIHAVHKHLKSDTIFLDVNRRAKITTPRYLSYLCNNEDHFEEAEVIRRVNGSQIHTDPEYLRTGRFTCKNDVYSFGIVLLEIISGKSSSSGDDWLIWTMERLEAEDWSSVVDPELEGTYSLEAMVTLASLALSCLQPSSSDRPEMRETRRTLSKLVIMEEDSGVSTGIRRARPFRREKFSSGPSTEQQMRCFSLGELSKATSDFKWVMDNESGDIGTRFHGRLENGVEVIVQELIRECFARNDKCFLDHVRLLSESSKHNKNLVCLLGFGVGKYSKYLVYENMPRGTLQRNLYQPETLRVLSWTDRLEIALDVATGLNDLHSSYLPRIVHQQVASKNIYLNQDGVAKLTTFAAQFQRSVEDVFLDTTEVYMDPEYLEIDTLTQETDVYSFGVVLIELICGSACLNQGLSTLVSMVRGQAKELLAIVDPSIRGKYTAEGMTTLAHLAVSCVELLPFRRPHLRSVCETLSKLLKHETQYNQCSDNNISPMLTTSNKRHGTLELTQEDPSVSTSGKTSSNNTFGIQGRAFTLAQVQAATSNCQQVLGKGGFGSVYYGRLNGVEVAVKIHDHRNAKDSGQGTDEFINEVSLLSRIHHKNILSLQGYCRENSQRILVYDYMSGGTLRQRLIGNEEEGRLSWKDRLQIALDAATGLEYLHNGCNPKIIHRDIKTNNILLDTKEAGKQVAKIADFGISKQYSEENANKTHLSTAVKGTFGYLDPQYFLTGCLTEASDVYSFGIVLLEIISGRPPNIKDHEDPGQSNLLEWGREKLKSKDLLSIVDSAMKGTYSPKVMEKVATLALRCAEFSKADRPDIVSVIRVLKEALDSESRREMRQDTGSLSERTGHIVKLFCRRNFCRLNCSTVPCVSLKHCRICWKVYI